MAKQEQRVYALRNATASDVARMLREVFFTPPGRTGRLTISVDDRTNSVILSGSAADLMEAEAVLNKIDIPGAGAASGRLELRVFALRHREPDATLDSALRMLIENRPGRFVVDRSRRQVLLHADQLTAELVEAVLSRLDVPAEVKALVGTDLEVRVSWVVSGPTRDGGKALDEFREATAELGRLGLDKPRLAAQVAVSTVPDAHFETTGLAAVEGSPSLFAVTGNVVDRKDAAGLDIDVSVTRVPTRQGGAPVCRLHSQVTAPFDRPLVLGTAPTEALKSAFVILVQRRKAPSAPAKASTLEFREDTAKK
jgi:hypothetical protein